MKEYVSSKHLEGVSDLTLRAPIKQGFIDAFEAVTYETRLRVIMKALFNIRSTAREHSKIKPFADTAERIQTLLDFRLAICGKDLLLSATFDKPFEPYIRLIWDPLGPLLDVIFCNCEGYVTATEHSFEEYLAWVRKSQIDTDFFYSSSSHSIADIQYVTKIEKLQREADKSLLPSAVTVVDPTTLAREFRDTEDLELKKETNKLGMEALVALYKLADFYPPDRPNGDAKYLLWAAQQLLDDWGRKDLKLMGPEGKDGKIVPSGWHHLVEDQLAWLERDGPPRKQICGERLKFRNKHIQGGIVSNPGGPKRPVKHGALLLMRIVDPVKARAFIRGLSKPKPTDPPDPVHIRPEPPKGETIEGTFLNLAFTCNGLVNIGLPQTEIDRFPQEFREGMEKRAGLLGDVRDNHPRRWALPPRNWPPRGAGDAPAPPVQISEVDLIIQVRTTTNYAIPYDVEAKDDHPLRKPIAALGAKPEESGVRLLSVEAMHPARTDGSKKDHFGYMDGLSQPVPVDGEVSRGDDEVPRGDILLGYSNSRGDDPCAPSPILDNGTFLVIRKLHQDAPGLDSFVRSEAASQQQQLDQEYQQAVKLAGADGEPPKKIQIDAELLYAKMMGRHRNGTPLAAPTNEVKDNRFTYRDDKEGQLCPFQAHARRTNPRDRKSDTNGRPTPRILRRGLSYGPLHKEGDTTDLESKGRIERGVFFMAYNASIAEQFEVIQRWVIGGNSTGVASWQSDPLMGVGQHGDPRTFRFLHEGREFSVNIPQPFVRLRWGAYLFVPSMDAIRTIATLLPDEHARRQAAELELARRGETIVAPLLALAAQGPEGRIAAGAGWKTCLEDLGAKDPAEKDEAAAVWAAIRLYHGGALKAPYGIVPPRQTPPDAVLVASKDLVMRVFHDPAGHYSMSGQMARMKQSFGEIYLGMDDGPEYRAKSRINEKIFAIPEDRAFVVARTAALNSLAGAVALAVLAGVDEWKIDLRRHFITPSLAIVCHEWFGIPDALPPGDVNAKNRVDPWGWSWEPAETRKPRCPGDYMATSRFCFYPDPIPRVRAYGKSHGQALRKAVRDHFEAHLPNFKAATDAKAAGAVKAPEGPKVGELTRAMIDLRTDEADRNSAPLYADADELARNVIGVMTGFLPPADGCMRSALFDWIDEETLPRVQNDLISHPSDQAFRRAYEALRPWLERAMQKRPAPDLLWRTATQDHRLGDVDVATDDRVIVSIVSALDEDAAAGITDVYPIFGGDRGAADPPLHACPAYKAAMGTMLGIFSALLESFRIEPLPSPMLVRISKPSAEMAALIAAFGTKLAAKAAAKAAPKAAAKAAPKAAAKAAAKAAPKAAAKAEDAAGAGAADAIVSGNAGVDASGKAEGITDAATNPAYESAK